MGMLYLKDPHLRYLKAQCWNEGRGCGTVLTASEIAHHFHRECRHHSICCPNCSTAVLSTDVFAHLNSEFCAAAMPSAHECEDTSNRNEHTALLMSFKQSFEEQAGQMKALMERLLVAYDAVGDRLSNVGHEVNSCQEALRGELREGVNRVESTVRQEAGQGRTEHRDCVQKCSDQISALSEETKAGFDAVVDTNEKISQNIHALEKVFRDEMAKVVKEMRIKGSPLPAGPEEVEGEQVDERKNGASGMDEAVPKPPDRNAAVYELVVKDFKSLLEEGRKGYVEYESGPVYVRGYCMSVGVQIDWDDLSLLIRPHKGDMDDALQWPFQKTIRVFFVHPKGGTDRELLVRPNELVGSFKRLREGGEPRRCYCFESTSPNGLIRDGYVADGQLRVKFELLP